MPLWDGFFGRSFFRPSEYTEGFDLWKNGVLGDLCKKRSCFILLRFLFWTCL